MRQGDRYVVSGPKIWTTHDEGRAVLQAAQGAPAPGRLAAIHAAAAHVMTLVRQASHEAGQMHGGIGTEELAVSHCFRRIMVVNRLLGDRAQQLRRFAELAVV